MIKSLMDQVHASALMRHVFKDIQLKSGDKISLVKKKDDNVPCIDFIELEQAPAPAAQA